MVEINKQETIYKDEQAGARYLASRGDVMGESHRTHRVPRNCLKFEKSGAAGATCSVAGAAAYLSARRSLPLLLKDQVCSVQVCR